jgi:hypothetical protein
MPKVSTRTERILAVYDTHGGQMTVSRLAALCWEVGVWDADEQRHMAFANAKRQCQTALESKDAAGLPVAGPTPVRDGQALVWKQIDMWTYDDAVFNLGLKIKQVDKDVAGIAHLHAWIDKRYGQAPPVPIWTYPEESPIWWYSMEVVDEGQPLHDVEAEA